MKLFVLSGITIIMLGALLIIGTMDELRVERNGGIVKMEILKLPISCLGTRSNHFMTLGYQNREYIKKIPGSFCDEHYVGEYINMLFLDESSVVLFPTESVGVELISSIFITLIGIFVVIKFGITLWRKS